MKPVSIVILGAPGLGKSTLAGSVMELPEVEKALLLIAKPGEEKSWLYEKYGLSDNAEIYFDEGWLPTLDQYKAGAYISLLRRIEGLRQDDEYDAVIIDPGTDVGELITHHLLAPNKVGSPGDLPNTQQYYAQLASKAQEFVGRANLLACAGLAKRPKFVLIPWHTQPPKEGIVQNLGQGVKTKTESADQKGQGIEYEGLVLPQLEGKYRRKLNADVDVTVFCDVETKKKVVDGKMTESTEFLMQVVPNKDRHSKIRIAPTLGKAMIPNRMVALAEAIEEVQGD